MSGTITTVISATIVLFVALGCLAILQMIRLKYEKSAYHEFFEKVRRRRESVIDLLEDVENSPIETRKEFIRLAEQLRNRVYDNRLQSTPVEQLANYGASHVNWSALTRAGISDCWDLGVNPKAEELAGIRGIGQTSARRIVQAQQQLTSEIEDTPLGVREIEQCAGIERLKELAWQIQNFKQPDKSVVKDARELLIGYEPPMEIAKYIAPDWWFEERLTELEERWEATGEDVYRHLEDISARLPDQCDAGNQDTRDLNAACSKMLQAVGLFELALPSRRTRSASSAPERESGRILPRDSDLRHTSGIQRTKFTAEHSFEERVISPLLDTLELDYERQKHVKIPTGSSYTSGYLDYLVRDDQGVLTVIENKKAIRSDQSLNKAVDQGVSYARRLRTASVVVAAPQGFWIYRLGVYQPELIAKIEPTDVVKRADDVLQMLRELRRS